MKPSLLIAFNALVVVTIAIGVSVPPSTRRPQPLTDDKALVAALDTQYQAAVARNDAAVMDRLLADDFVLVTSSGNVFTKTHLLNEARSARVRYERQEDSNQTVRVWGDTAVITAQLSAKGAEDGKPFDYTLWFSDTYVRNPAGWRYVFGQAGAHLPKNE